MCTYYEVPGREQLVRHFGDVPEEEWRDKMSPLYRGPFLRAQGEAQVKSNYHLHQANQEIMRC